MSTEYRPDWNFTRRADARIEEQESALREVVRVLSIRAGKGHVTLSDLALLARCRAALGEETEER